MGLRDGIVRWLLAALGEEPAAREPRSREAHRAPARPVAPPPPPPPEAGAGTAELAAQRRKLVSTCIAVGDQVGSEMLQDRIADALEEVGVRPFRPDGERFDPNHHRAAGKVPAESPDQDGLIAMTQRPGYVDGDEVIRLPEVLVWRAEKSA